MAILEALKYFPAISLHRFYYKDFFSDGVRRMVTELRPRSGLDGTPGTNSHKGAFLKRR